MGKLVVSEFVTLDGVFEDPGGAENTEHGGWSFRFERGPEGDKFKFDELMAADALLLGRKTYEGFATAWPQIKDEQGFSDKMNGMRKYVVTTTVNKLDWNNSELLPLSTGDLKGAVEKVKQDTQGDVLIFGSGQLIDELMRQGDLIDEYRLMVYPVVLGGGKHLFENVPSTELKLANQQTLGDGVIVLTYTHSE